MIEHSFSGEISFLCQVISIRNEPFRKNTYGYLYVGLRVMGTIVYSLAHTVNPAQLNTSVRLTPPTLQLDTFSIPVN